MSEFVIEEQPIFLTRKLLRALPPFEAMFIQQLTWLLREGSSNGKVIGGKRWIFNTVDQWHKQYFDFLPKRNLERLIANLEATGLLLSCKPEGSVSRRKYYRIADNSEAILKSLCEKRKAPKASLKQNTPSMAGPSRHEWRNPTTRHQRRVPITEYSAKATAKDSEYSPNASGDGEEIHDLEPLDQQSDQNDLSKPSKLPSGKKEENGSAVCIKLHSVPRRPSEEELEAFILDEGFRYLTADIAYRKFDKKDGKNWWNIGEWKSYLRKLEAKMHSDTIGQIATNLVKRT